MYYVGEIYVGFDCDKCFFDTLEDAQNELNRITLELVELAPYRAELLRDYISKGYAIRDVEHWIIQDRITGELMAEKTIEIHANGFISIK